MRSDRRIFFTPGPLTLSPNVLSAMQDDWGSRDPSFIELTGALLSGLKRLFSADDEYVLIPLQGSGTYAVEAMIGSIIPPTGKLLVFDNGSYADRMGQIAAAIRRPYCIVKSSYIEPLNIQKLREILAQDRSITHVGMVHLETVSGLLNPISEISNVVNEAGCKLLIDAMSSFGAFDLDVNTLYCDAIAFSSNKCLQGPPGLGFVLARESALVAGLSPSLALDLNLQLQYFKHQAQWRFTPPTHVVAATYAALRELQNEGGIAKRLARYSDNFSVIYSACTSELGLTPLLRDSFLSPIILALKSPQDPMFSFDELYQYLKAQNLYIYPGNITGSNTFRIGCIGDIDRTDMSNLAVAMVDYWRKAGVNAQRSLTAG